MVGWAMSVEAYEVLLCFIHTGLLSSRTIGRFVEKIEEKLQAGVLELVMLIAIRCPIVVVVPDPQKIHT
jgi:hypothetical protein